MVGAARGMAPPIHLHASGLHVAAQRRHAACVRHAASPSSSPQPSPEAPNETSTEMRPMPVDHSSSPFHELDLTDLWHGVGQTRVRQHVNPLRSEYMQKAAPVDWHAAFDDPSLPLILDLGCGPGRFLLLLYKRDREHATDASQKHNYLGIEIRKPLVDRANEWVARLGFGDRVHFIYSNATINLESIMSTYPGAVQSVCIQFPDPHFKKRHRKRRIFQPNLVRAVRDMLPIGGKLFLQSDVEMVSSAMRNCFECYASDSFQLAPEHSGQDADVFFSAVGPSANGAESATPPEPLDAGTDAAVSFEQAVTLSLDGTGDSDGEAPPDAPDDGDYEAMESTWARGGWLRKNPVGVPTEREYACGVKGLPVYRVLLVRK